MPAKDLLGHDGTVKPLVRQKALEHRGHERDHRFGIFVTAAVGGVDQGGAPEHESARALDKAFLGHQRPAHVRVHDDGIGRAVGVLDPGHIPTLKAVAGVVHGVLIGSGGLCHALHADRKPCFVHHGEHRPQALVLFADQISGGAVIVHHTGRIAVDAHLFLDVAAGHAIACAQRSVFIDQEFRDNEQRDALDPFGASGDLCQHQMDDIL